MYELNYYAPLNQLGYGQVGINFALGLAQAGVNLSIFPIGEPTPNSKDLDFVYRNLGSRNPPRRHAPCLKIWHQNDLFDFIGKGKHIGFPIFELDRFTIEEQNSMESCDEVFVCSEWAKQMLRWLNRPVKVVPLGFNPDIFKPAPMLSGPTRFFNAGKWEVRKGHDFLLECFNKAFTLKDNVELHMLSHNPFPQGKSEEWEKRYKTCKMASKIRLLPRQATHENVYYIMKQVDCGIFPARAEGWNLELLELMACSKHVIATNYSGHTEFCTKDSCRFIEITSLEAASDGIWFNGFGHWAHLGQEQEEQLINHMREVHKLKQENGRLEQNHAGILQASKFTWAKSTSKLLKAIYDDRTTNSQTAT